MASALSSKIFFPKLNMPIRLSQHAALRLKQRAGLNSKKRRTEFLKKVAKSALTLSDIPLNEEFSPLIIYLRQVYKKVRKKNIYCMIYLYQQYIFIVSVDSVIITVITVEEPYEKSYQRVKEFINKNQ